MNTEDIEVAAQMLTGGNGALNGSGGWQGFVRLAEIRYDYRNQMVEYEDLDLESTHSYAYDCFGRRIRKTTGFGATTRYINGGPPPMNWQVLEERDGSGTGTNAGAVKATYVYGNYIDEPISMRRDVAAPSGTPEDYFFFADDLFNVTCLATASGTVVERYRYGDYGLPTILTAPLSGTATELYESAYGNTRLWNGREFDREISF